MKGLTNSALICIFCLFSGLSTLVFSQDAAESIAADGINGPSTKQVSSEPDAPEDEQEKSDEDGEIVEDEDEVKDASPLEKGVHFQSFDDPDENAHINPSIEAVYTHSREVEPSKITPFSANILGDSINPLDGQLSISQTDISLPGNSNLPVEFTRRFSGFFNASSYEFGRWRLNLPSLETMSYSDEWFDPRQVRLTGASKFDWHDNRCERLVSPDFSVRTFSIDSGLLQLYALRRGSKYFKGLTLNAPGAWGEKIMPLDPNMSASTKFNIFGASAPKYVTKSNWKFECLPSVKNGSGQGFKGIAPNGDVYFFDTLVRRVTSLKRLHAEQSFLDAGTIFRVMLAASRVEDVHGNWVTYTYDDNGYIQKIEANDGRQIDVTVVPRAKRFAYRVYTPDLVESATVTAHGKTWVYNFSDTDDLEVTLPSEVGENKKWVYEFDISDSISPYTYEDQPGQDYVTSKICDYSSWPQRKPMLAKITHPSGLKGEFTVRKPNTKELDGSIVINPLLRITKSGLSHIAPGPDDGHHEYPCAGVSIESPRPISGFPIYDDAIYSYNTAEYTLPIAEKKLYGPGLEPLVWRYGYQQGEHLVNGLRLGSSSDLPLTTQRTILDPDGNLTVMDVIRKNDVRYGKVQKTDYYIDANRANSATFEGLAGVGQFNGYVLQKSNQVTYTESQPIGKPWEAFYHPGAISTYKPNLALTDRNALISEQVQRIYNADGTDVYTTRYSYNNNTAHAGYSYGKPVRIEAWSNISTSSYGARRIRNIEYQHIKNKWILGLPKKLSLGNPSQQTLVRENRYFNNSPLVQQSYHFGLLQDTNTYHSNGQLKRKTFNVSPSRWREFSDYHRGTPQQVKITSGDSAFTSVNDFGQTVSSTDFEGNCVTYEYDAEMRLSLINPCSIAGQGASATQHSEWASTHINFSWSLGGELSGVVSSGMLKQSVSRGGYRQETYFDALQRPIFSKTWDVSAANNAVYGYTQFDTQNRPVFTARPASVLNTHNGSITVYDGIGRTKLTDDTQTTAIDSEYAYQSENQVRMTNARGYSTTTTYLGFAGPSQSQPIRIESPEGVTTTFSEFNHLLQPQRIQQGGQSEIRRYHKGDMCFSSRADIGKRWYGYNALGEQTWAVLGVAPNGASANACYLSGVPSTNKTVKTYYDNLGNVSRVDYPSGTPDKLFTYNKNSQPTRLVYGSVTHELNYIDDLIDVEKVSIDGRTLSLSYKYDALKHPKHMTYPSGRAVSLRYNALGQALSIGSYANQASYHPNGLLAGHRYGNGAVYGQTLTSRNTPERLSDQRSGRYLNHQTLTYDDMNNLTQLVDGRDSRYNLALSYDGLDRLKAINDSFSGTGYFNYDTLGNIRKQRIGGRTIDYHYDNKNRLQRTTNGYIRNFGYDELGNVRSNGQHTFIYDLAGNMTLATQGSTRYHYAYDGNGKRVKSVDSKGTSYSMYGQNGKLMYRYAGNKHIDYIYLGAKLVTRHESTSGTGGTQATAFCGGSYTYNSATKTCQGLGGQAICPVGQDRVNGQCVASTSSGTCRDNSAAPKTCTATDNTYVLLGQDRFGFFVSKAQWAGVNIPLTSETEVVNVNGYSYWMGDFSSAGWVNVIPYDYYDDQTEQPGDEYYYDYYEACRCSLTQAVSSSQSCPANYSLNSSGLCQQQQTFNGALALSCAAGYTLNGSQCARTTSNNIVYIHSDWLGSPVAETNTSGNLVGSFMHYQAFGETIEAPKDEVGYTGHKFDTDLGLSYMQARYYDPVIGRFYSNDPIGYTAQNPVMSFNRYLYVNNNPYKYTDPNGEFLLGAVIGVVLEVGIQAATGELSLSGESLGKIALAGAAGAVGAGIATAATKLASVAKLGKAGTAAANLGGDVASSVSGTAITGGELSVEGVAANIVGGKVGANALGAAAKNLPASAKNITSQMKPEGSPNSRKVNRKLRRQANSQVKQTQVSREATGAAIGSGAGQRAVGCLTQEAC